MHTNKIEQATTTFCFLVLSSFHANENRRKAVRLVVCERKKKRKELAVFACTLLFIMPQTRSRAKQVAAENNNSQNVVAKDDVVVETIPKSNDTNNNNGKKTSKKSAKETKKQEEVQQEVQESKPKHVLDAVPTFISSVVDKPERFVSEDTKKLNTEIVQLTKGLFDLGMRTNTHTIHHTYTLDTYKQANKQYTPHTHRSRSHFFKHCLQKPHLTPSRAHHVHLSTFTHSRTPNNSEKGTTTAATTRSARAVRGRI